MDERERGSVLPLVAVVMVAAGGLCLGMGRLGGQVTQAGQARTAADAAALAGAADGRTAADALARANGGRVVAYDEDGAEVQVRVRVGRAEATARATPAWSSASAG
jgi:hypothetical protein